MLHKLIFTLIVLSSCTSLRDNTQCLQLGETSDVQNQVEYRKSVQYNKQDSLKNKVSLVFTNNPYCLDTTYWVNLYANNIVIYSGTYSVSKKVEIPIEKDVPTHFILEVITPENGKKVYLHRFQDKSVFPWRNEYNYIYIGFFPTNDETNRIHFFPQIEGVLQ